MELKKIIDINFKYFGDGFDPEDNFFTNILRKKYKVTISKNPKFIFYSVYSVKNKQKNLYKKGDLLKKISPRLYIFLRKSYDYLKKIKNKNLTPEGDFLKIFIGSEHTKPNMKECDWAFSTFFEDVINNPHYMRIPCYVINDFQIGEKASPPIDKNINIQKIRKLKNKFCNFIYSQEIIARNKSFKKINQYKKVDAPGRCMNNMSPIGSHEDSKKSRMFENWVEEKLDFIKDYKFTIAFENHSLSGWVTEKLTHPMLVNSIPIYFGHPDIAREFNTKSFINSNDFKNMEDLIKYITKVDGNDSLYETYLKEPFYKKDQEIKPFNEKKLLNRFEEIFE